MSLLVGATLVATLGCTQYSGSRAVVFGPLVPDHDALVARVVSAGTTAGYTPARVDAASGRIEFEARWRPRRGDTARFEVQLFEGGWARVTVLHPSVRQTEPDGTFSAPSELRHEYETFVIAMRDAGLGARP